MQRTQLADRIMAGQFLISLCCCCVVVVVFCVCVCVYSCCCFFLSRLHSRVNMFVHSHVYLPPQKQLSYKSSFMASCVLHGHNHITNWALWTHVCAFTCLLTSTNVTLLQIILCGHMLVQAYVHLPPLEQPSYKVCSIFIFIFFVQRAELWYILEVCA